MFFQKSHSVSLFCLLSLCSSIAAAEPRVEIFQPAVVDVAPDRVFTPLGFDDNDNAQIVLDGALPDTCYKLGPTRVRVDHEAHKVFLRQQAFYYPGGWCAEVRIPYVQTVDLGILNAGQYSILVEQDTLAARALATLPIAIATSSSPDDFLYAPVTETHLERTADALDGRKPGVSTLVLGGAFASSCMVFSRVKMNVRANNVIEILPIVNMERGTSCAQVTNDFSIRVSLKEVPHGRFLVHVRSLNGQSLNRIVEL